MGYLIGFITCAIIVVWVIFGFGNGYNFIPVALVGTGMYTIGFIIDKKIKELIK